VARTRHDPGVAIQFLCLLPSLARSDLWRLSFRFDRRDPAVRAVGRLGSWTLMVVLANQLSLYVVLAYAFGIGGNGPVSAYTYGWSFMQMPYAVVVVSVLGSLTPQLAGLATAEDFSGLSERLRFALRQSLVIIIPCTLVLVILAQPIAESCSITPTRCTDSRRERCSRSSPPDCLDSPCSNSARGAFKQCSARARSSTSTCFRMD